MIAGVDVAATYTLPQTYYPSNSNPPFAQGTVATGTDGSHWIFVKTTGALVAGAAATITNTAGVTTGVGITTTNGAFGNPTGITPGGLFAQPSNSGTTSRNVFAVAPEVAMQVGFDWTPRLRSFVGYNFLYMSNVLRPGNQLDRNINPTQNAFLVPPGTLMGPAAPAPC